MAQHNALPVHTDIFVPPNKLLLLNAMLLPALHQMQQVKQIAMGRVSQTATGFDLCNVNTILYENS